MTAVAFAIRSPALERPIETAAQLPALTTQSHALVVSETSGAIKTGRELANTFDKNTAYYGKSNRGLICRFVGRHSQGLAATALVGLLAAVSMPFCLGAAGVSSIFGLSLWNGVFLPTFGAAMGCYAGPLAAGNVEALWVRSRKLSGKSVEWLRTAFDAPGGTPLERAVIAESAARFLKDFESREVYGEAPRLVLGDIVARAEAIDAEVREAARATLDCMAVIYFEEGKLKSRLTANEVEALEHCLARTKCPYQTALRDSLLTVLFDGERPRVKLEHAPEARLYRVLTGADAPKAPPVRPRPDKDLAAAAQALAGELFVDGVWAAALTEERVARLFTILRTAGQTKALPAPADGAS